LPYNIRAIARPTAIILIFVVKTKTLTGVYSLNFYLRLGSVLIKVGLKQQYPEAKYIEQL